jgi:hypothetical protein
VVLPFSNEEFLEKEAQKQRKLSTWARLVPFPFLPSLTDLAEIPKTFPSPNYCNPENKQSLVSSQMVSSQCDTSTFSTEAGFGHRSSKAKKVGT